VVRKLLIAASVVVLAGFIGILAQPKAMPIRAWLAANTYELRFPEIARELAKKGAEVLFVIAQFPLERIEHWRILLRARAIENQLFVVGVNCVNSLCGGHSAVIDPWGKTLIEGSDEGCTISVEIDTSLVSEIRKRYPFLGFDNI